MKAPQHPERFSPSFIFKICTAVLLGSMLFPLLTGCKPKQDAALEHAKQQAASTGQPQQIVSTDKNGNTVTTVVQPPVAGQQGQVVTTTVTPKSASAAVSGQAGPAAGQTAPASPASSLPAAQPAAPQPAPQVHVAAGTALVIRINQRISAKGSHAGEHFTGDVEEPVMDEAKQVIIPKGADVRGVVQVAQSRGDFKGAAELKLRLTSLKLNGTEYPLDTKSVLREKKGKGKRSAGFIGGGTGLGLLLGGLAGGGRGAAIGGLAGAGAGTATAGLTDNGDLVIDGSSE